MPRTKDKRSLHEKIAADLRAKIMSGDLAAGQQLGTTTELMEQYRASNPTIQAALTVLKEEGLVVGQRGKGVFVRNNRHFIVGVSAYYDPSTTSYTYRLLDVAIVEPPAEVRHVFNLDPGGRAVLRRRITDHEGDPVELCDSYYPLELADGTELAEARRIRGGAPRVLTDLGFPEVSFEDQISVRPPTTEEFEELGLLPNVPVIRQFRVVFSHNERPVEASILIKAGNLYELRYRQPVTDP